MWSFFYLPCGFGYFPSIVDLLTVTSDRIARVSNLSDASLAVTLNISKDFDRMPMIILSLGS